MIVSRALVVAEPIGRRLEDGKRFDVGLLRRRVATATVFDSRPLETVDQRQPGLRMQGIDMDARIDLDQALGSGDNLAGYARTRVWSPVAQDVRLELGSDDYLQVLLNGRELHRSKLPRAAQPEAAVKVKQRNAERRGLSVVAR